MTKTQLRARTGTAAILLIGVGSVVAYALTAAVMNAQPPTNAFPGWITVLESAQGFGENHQVKLRIDALEPGAPGEHPALRYSVAACGDAPFTGLLLIGGASQLADAEVRPGSNPRQRSHASHRAGDSESSTQIRGDNMGSRACSGRRDLVTAACRVRSINLSGGSIPRHRSVY
jgi:hypothetical protein